MAVDSNEVVALIAALDRHVADAGAMANALVELDGHPGHQLFTATLSTGRTAEQWTVAEALLAELWRDFDTFRAVLADAEQVRARRSKLGPNEVADLRRLLVEPTVEIARRTVPLTERGLTGAAEQVESITVDALTTRMNDAYRTVSDLAVRCDALSSAALKSLAPLLDQARQLAGDIADLELTGLEATPVLDVVDRVREMEVLAGSDPLTLADQPLDEALAGLTAQLTSQRQRVDRILALREGWRRVRGDLAEAVQALTDLRTQTANDYEQAAAKVTAQLPPLPPDRQSALRATLDRLDVTAEWSVREAEIEVLGRDIAAADAELREARELATGLLDRRAELRGRFGAFQARAVRLRLAEDPSVMEVADRIKATLWRRPSDLAAATRDLGVFRRLLDQPGTDKGRDWA